MHILLMCLELSWAYLEHVFGKLQKLPFQMNLVKSLHASCFWTQTEVSQVNVAHWDCGRHCQHCGNGSCQENLKPGVHLWQSHSNSHTRFKLNGLKSLLLDQGACDIPDIRSDDKYRMEFKALSQLSSAKSANDLRKRTHEWENDNGKSCWSVACRRKNRKHRVCSMDKGNYDYGSALQPRVGYSTPHGYVLLALSLPQTIAIAAGIH